MRPKRLPHELWRIKRARIWERDGHRCQSPLEPPLCIGKPEIAFRKFALDHIIPLCEGGTNDDDNLRVLCPVCHALRARLNHQGLIARALRLDLIPPDWRRLVWED